MTRPRTLIAGFGNVLRGDDGFGVEVVRRLSDSFANGWSEHVSLLDVGTGGLHLAQELLGGYDVLILVDAMTAGGPPGALYVREITDVEPAEEVDLHLALPARALSVARALGALPERVFLVGCEPAATDDLALELSAPVRAAVDQALRRIRHLVEAAPR